MKASYRKTKTGFYPVIIFNNKSRMTHRVLCLTKDSAIRLADSIIMGIDQYQKDSENVYETI